MRHEDPHDAGLKYIKIGSIMKRIISDDEINKIINSKLYKSMKFYNLIIIFPLILILSFYIFSLKIENKKLKSFVHNLATLNNISCKNNKELEGIVNSLSRKKIAIVSVSCYNSTVSQTDSTPETNASNTLVGPGQVAVSRDLFKNGFSFNKKLYIDGYGFFKITDLMNERFKNSIDIWLPVGEKQFKEEKVLAIVIN